MPELTPEHREQTDGEARFNTPGKIRYCNHCGEEWPCAASRLFAEVAAQRAEIAALRQERDEFAHGVVEQRGWRHVAEAKVRVLEAQRDALLRVARAVGGLRADMTVGEVFQVLSDALGAAPEVQALLVAPPPQAGDAKDRNL